MSLQGMIPSLIFMTLFAGAGFALVQFLLSLQRRSNRVAASDTLIGDSSHTTVHNGKVPEGALPELLSLLGVAVVAMGLLTFAYKSSGRGADPVAVVPSGTLSTPAAPGAQMTVPSQPRAAPDEKPNVPTSATSPGSGG